MPIKRNSNIAPLSREHHHGLLFCWKIQQGVKFDISFTRMQNYAVYFWQHILKIHFEKEENVLFNQLTCDLVNQAIYQHKQIQKQFELMVCGIAEQATLSDIADMISKHIRFEERVLFPYLEQHLEKSQLKIIGSSLDNLAKLQIEDEYKDTFWIR